MKPSTLGSDAPTEGNTSRIVRIASPGSFEGDSGHDTGSVRARGDCAGGE